MTGVTTLDLQFWVELDDGSKDLAADMTLTDVSFGFSAVVSNMDVGIQLGKINIDSVKINSCSFGRLSAALIKTELNNFFRVFIGPVNSFLSARHIHVPSNYFGIFELNSLVLDYYDNFVYAGATPVFVGLPTQII